MREMDGFKVTPVRKAMERLRDHYSSIIGNIDRDLLVKDKC
jgi:hypothetical protein